MQIHNDLRFTATTDAKFPGQSQNQDSVYAYAGRTENNVLYGIFVVADGVGGLKDGRRASQTVVETVEAHFEPLWPAVTAVSDQTVARLRQQLKKAIHKANDAIRALSNDKEERMASTITCALVVDQAIIVANAGDSRTYLYRQKQLEQLTQDHSLVAWLLRQEHITAEEALNHPYKNVLTHALGATEKPQIDLFTHRLFPGDWLLLCSDGIWGTLPDAKLAEYLQTAVSPEEIAPTIMQAAQNHSDDLSLVLVHLPLM